MFAGFNLDLTNDFNAIIDFSKYKIQGINHLNNQKKACEKSIRDYVINGIPNNIVNGSKLQDDWFPQVNVDVFISHSHKDLELAQGFAGWLNDKFGLKCFLDANVWGYADNLLEEINSIYSDKRTDENGGYLYNHNKCNIASKHVNIMLSIALQKMIDKTEATFVINTPHSIQKYVEEYNNSTYSPWIYTEIICTEIVRKKSLSEYRKQSICKFANESTEIRNESGYQAVYAVSFEHLKNIDATILKEWDDSLKQYKWLIDDIKPINHLDLLYSLVDNDAKQLIKLYNKYPQILFE